MANQRVDHLHQHQGVGPHGPHHTTAPIVTRPTMARVDQPPRRGDPAVPIGRSGRESLVALSLVAAIAFLLTDSVPIGVAVLGCGLLIVGAGLLRAVHQADRRRDQGNLL